MSNKIKNIEQRTIARISFPETNTVKHALNGIPVMVHGSREVKPYNNDQETYYIAEVAFFNFADDTKVFHLHKSKEFDTRYLEVDVIATMKLRENFTDGIMEIKSKRKKELEEIQEEKKKELEAQNETTGR